MESHTSNKKTDNALIKKLDGPRGGIDDPNVKGKAFMKGNPFIKGTTFIGGRAFIKGKAFIKAKAFMRQSHKTQRIQINCVEIHGML